MERLKEERERESWESRVVLCLYGVKTLEFTSCFGCSGGS